MTADLWTASSLHELTEEECRELIATRPVGRVAWTAPDGPVVLPVTYVVAGDEVLLRTSPLTDLGRHARASRDGFTVAFQVDDHDEFHRSGWSVLLRGTAEVVEPDALDRAPAVPVPWAGGSRPLLLRIRPRVVSGRRLLGT